MTNATRDEPSVEKYAKHVNPAFVKLLGVFGYGRLLVRARDVWVWDHQDRRYLDLLAGFGSVNVGHNHPRMAERMKRFLSEDALNFVHVGPSAPAADLAAELARLAGPPLEVCLFSNTGAEAVEGGMKLARIATGRKGFLSCEGGYHGQSFGTLSISGVEKMREPFGDLLEGCARVPFGDLDALEKALRKKDVAGFVVDPFLCEAEVTPPPPGYLRGAQELCRRYGTVFILDEVQTGIGRTGTLFAYQAEGFVPDVLVLAKSLSGGVAPVGVTLTSADLHGRVFSSMDRFGLHASTFAANAFSCTAALEALSIVSDEKLVERSAARGVELQAALRKRLAGHPLVRDIRGRGLLVGIELGPTDKGFMNRLAPSVVRSVSRNVFGQWAAVKLLERDIICQPASQHWNVLKIEPPLTIAPAEVEKAVATIGETLDEYQGVTALMNDVVQRLGKQFLAGWAF
ncbi:MAG TPA: aspartate aminotransferase family protein [Planctomycetota bacterium]|nr:aspartate aminotransferase family protein [Planctomycetota bacterium]